VINKIDRSHARPAGGVSDEVYDLFIDLDAKEDQIDFPMCSIRTPSWHCFRPTSKVAEKNLQPLFEAIVKDHSSAQGDSRRGPAKFGGEPPTTATYLGRLCDCPSVQRQAMFTGRCQHCYKLDGSFQKDEDQRSYSSFARPQKRTDINRDPPGGHLCQSPRRG